MNDTPRNEIGRRCQVPFLDGAFPKVARQPGNLNEGVTVRSWRYVGAGRLRGERVKGIFQKGTPYSHG